MWLLKCLDGKEENATKSKEESSVLPTPETTQISGISKLETTKMKHSSLSEPKKVKVLDKFTIRCFYCVNC